MSHRRLVVNLDHVATLRQACGADEPDPAAVATLAFLGGADEVSLHLREDRRHAQDRDARMLAQIAHGRMSLEIAPTPEMLKLALELRPRSTTLVAERPEELKTESGVDVLAHIGSLGEIVRALADGDTSSSVLVDAEIGQVKGAHRIGARGIRIFTGRYAEGGPGCEDELRRICDAARLAGKLGLAVSVGGGLDERNVRPLLEFDDVGEIAIGHSIVAQAVQIGMERAVRQMKSIVE